MSVAEAVLTNGFAEIGADSSVAPDLRNIREGMKLLTENPSLAERFPWRKLRADDYGDKYCPEVGLVKRDDEEHKYIFQYTRSPAGGFSPAYEPDLLFFWASLENLTARAHATALETAKQIDRFHGQMETSAYGGSLATRVKGGTAITRVLRYLPSPSCGTDAFTHIDRGIFAVHLGATHTGLYMYKPSGQRVRVDETSGNRVVIFPGRKFAAIARGYWGFGTPHGVKYDRVINEDRYSFVTFVHPKSNKSDAKWLLDHDEEIKKFERSIML
jgi:hypothetical protein